MPSWALYLLLLTQTGNRKKKPDTKPGNPKVRKRFRINETLSNTCKLLALTGYMIFLHAD